MRRRHVSALAAAAALGAGAGRTWPRARVSRARGHGTGQQGPLSAQTAHDAGSFGTAFVE